MKQGQTTYARDPETGALINTDTTKLEAVRKRREQVKQQQDLTKRVTQLEARVLALESKSCACGCK